MISPVRRKVSHPRPRTDVVHITKLTEVGLLRHPKPITPSDLHLVLEKEQEAMVIRPHMTPSLFN
jgi:hypothetical protein